MQRSYFTKSITTTFIGILVLLLGATVAVAQQQVNLTAAPTSLTLPDGSNVPMWGYTCSVTGTPAAGTSAQACSKLSPAATTGWSPIVITVPYGENLQIGLTNNLTFGANSIPTSIVIVGQLGGGLGNSATSNGSPAHENLSTTWPIANSGPVFVPPTQGTRVQSLAGEVSAVASTTTPTCTVPSGSVPATGCGTLTWSNLRPGTYLLESGTHPSIQVPMGLYGIVVVTTVPGASAGCAYPGATAGTCAVNYNAEVPLLFSEIDPGQNNAVSSAVNTSGFSESATLGPYSAQPLTSINLLNPGHGYSQSTTTVQLSGGGCTTSTCAAAVSAVVDSDPASPTYQQITGFNITSGGSYTSAPNVTIVGACAATTANPCASADAALQLATSTTCSGGATACYPPAVNYTPLYYLINGQAFDKTTPGNSLFAAAPASGVTGTVLVRMVNAGLRMHVPSIVGAQTGTSNTSGFTLIAEDGNPLPGVARVQNEVFMSAGKTYDVMMNVPATVGNALPIYDRELSLSGNSTNRDAGMLAYIGVNGAGVVSSPALTAAVANPDSYTSVVPGKTLTISNASKGVLANDVNIYGVQVSAAPGHGTLTLSANGTFTYTPDSTWGSGTTQDTFGYCGNGLTSGNACTTVTLNLAQVEAASGITCIAPKYTASTSTYLAINTPGVLVGCKDAAGYPLTVDTNTVAVPSTSSLVVVPDVNGGFAASAPGAGTYTFTFQPLNTQGTHGAAVTATLTFPAGSGLTVTVKDPTTGATINDYRWIIEEDRTFYVDPTKTTNSGTVPLTFGVNFHTSHMPVVATGCAGPAGAMACETGQTLLGVPAVCDVGNGSCRTTGTQRTAVDPSQVVLDPNKRYYISVLPGDAANPFNTGNGQGGHGMGGAPISAGQTAVTVLVEPSPYQTAKLSVFVFEDDFPLNGEQDGGGGIDVLSPNEPGLGSFNITIMDDAGGTGDATGQVDYDMFNMPLTNSLNGTLDPQTGLNACPISQQAQPITGTIVTCPKYEADGVTLSPLAGQAVVANMMPGRYGVVATPSADRIARGEEWLQTNTLDGQKAHDSFLRIGEPSFFQEYGPAGYHVSIGFANPAIINSRLAGVCSGTDPNVTGSGCTVTVQGTVTTERTSRTPDERLYSSGDNTSFGFTQCYVSFGDPDGEDFAFTKCDSSGHFVLSGLPQTGGPWRLTVFDQWNDMLVDGLSTPVDTSKGGTVDLGQVATSQWQANIYTTTFFDTNKNGVRDPGEPGLTLVPTNIRFRDGSFSNFNNTDLNGNAGFNEVFPLFSWYVVETDSTRYKNTGTHVVYDAGGPADGCGNTDPTAPCGNSNIAGNLANSYEAVPVPTDLRVPGARYCASADCPTSDLGFNPGTSTSYNSSIHGSTGRVDPAWVVSEGWQGFSGQNSFLEFGKTPFAAGENGGIRGHVVYASTRPFDDPQLLLQNSWAPLVPNVTINLYQEGSAPDGSQSLVLVDTTQTSSFDDWAQGFRSDGKPNMNCPGQGSNTGTNPDLFFFSLYNQPQWLDYYNNVLHGTGSVTALPMNSQFKCYDGMHNWNQLQPAPYDGMYKFPSIAGRDPATGKPVGGTNTNVAGTFCTVCVANPVDGEPMLPNGKYVVEVVVPPGYELVKEEDKNILIGDNFIAPVVQEFAGLGNVFILPDQAAIASSYNSNNAQNQTQDLGRSTFPATEGDTGSVEVYWPCAGALRTVPDFISLFPQSGEVAPFAGASRRLCDRKEVTLEDQSSVLAKFYIFTSTHIAAHFTGVITDDYTSEFDPFSPQFGEKFAPPDLPIAIKDFAGNEISRVYADHWGAYNGLTYSTWEVNPPNPTGYSPTMMVTCMNDPGTGATPDPLFNPEYSQFCYEIPFMPGQTQYMDTPVVPTSAYAGAGYNNPDCFYPASIPAIKEVDGDGVGPWVSAAGNTLTITALGDTQVPNNAYSGPSATTAPYNQKFVTRHYGFGTNQGTVTIGGAPANITGWTDAKITVTVPSVGGTGGIPQCAIQQQAQYKPSGTVSATPTAYCGQLLITTAGNHQSIDTVTVTVGGKKPTRLAAGQTIQNAIDLATPGDLIIVPPGQYQEMVQMWKPVRLQGVGAASSIINGNTHPAGKIDTWRARITCLFGLGLDGAPADWNASCGSGWSYFTAAQFSPQVDRLPLEATVGWQATLNGNLAELLQEPTLMGALEGAGITVLSRGVDFHGQDPFVADTFPTGTTLLTGNLSNSGTLQVGDANALCKSGTSGKNLYPSNFVCNPSAIDGLSVTDSSQGGGAIFVHAWGHYIQIANNRVMNNAGTLGGGVNIGQGEFPPAYLLGGGATNAAPGSCSTTSSSGLPNSIQPYCHNVDVNVHNNMIVYNSSTGDELFSATPAGAGGVNFCTGSDYYKFNNNWVCGNLGTGDGGGLGHLGFIYSADIEHNSFLFNQSTNPTIPTNGGAVVIMGAPDVDPPCGATTDADCVSPLGSIGPSDGAGPHTMVNANLFLGNQAESGSGGAIALQNINGSDIVSFPTTPTAWNDVTVTNNIIVNNVAGWDGGGVSLLDALNTNIINNTIVSNDSTASAGPLFDTLGAPLASTQGTNCHNTAGTASCPQPAGLVSEPNSSVLVANLPTSITCPKNHYAGTTASNGTCRAVSYPELYNNMFWQNRSFYIGVGGAGSGVQNQQNLVTLFNAFGTTGAPSQPQVDATAANGGGIIVTGGTGACTTASYWDIGVRGDTSPTGGNSLNVRLGPQYSVLTDAADYPGGNNSGSNPTVVSQYCNGSRVPPELGSMGYQVPAGISDATVPNPIFNLNPTATVDEGNNWVNISWGPLSLVHPVNGTTLGNYAPAPGSPAIDYILPSATTYAAAPALDFFGNSRKTSGNPNVDVGAVEVQGLVHPVLSSISPTSGFRGNNVNVTLTGTGLTGTTTINGATGIVVSNLTVVSDTQVTATFAIATTATTGARTISVTTPNGTSNTVSFTVQNPPAPTLSVINPNTGVRGNNVTVTLTGTNFTTNGTTVAFTTGTGITVTGTTVVSSTTITATFVIGSGAGLGGHNVRVTTPGGNSGTLPFTVTGAALSSISPVSSARGTTVNVTLTGTALTGATSVTVSGTGVSVSNFTPVNATSVTATFTIASNAALGSRTVTVNAPAGSPTIGFQITGATLTISAPTPALNSGGTNTKTGTITVSNTATGANVGPFTFSLAPAVTQTAGPTGSSFSILTGSSGGTCVNGFAIAAGSNCTIVVQYSPNGSTTTATAHVTVTGTGITGTPAAATSPATQNGGNFNAN